MELKFYYNYLNPDCETYKDLLIKMKSMSKKFFELDRVFNLDFNRELIRNYEDKKKEIICEMFSEIINCFSFLNNVPCAIYLNGSFARGDITAGSDIDLTFYFKKNDVSQYQTAIYLIRNAIATMFGVNVVHVHSFTKNFITEFREKNNLVIVDQELKTKIIWLLTGECYNIYYPKNQMIAEREFCEINSIKDIDSLTELFNNQLEKLHPKEWIYTHKCIHSINNNFSINGLIQKLDSMYSTKEIQVALNNIKREIEELIQTTAKYYSQLELCSKIDLSSYNMIGKRNVTMLVHAFATYLRWYYISHNFTNVPMLLNLHSLFNYKNDIIDNHIINEIDKSYCYFRFLISRIEIWAKKYNHYYGHRSEETVKRDILNIEYQKLWGKKYSPITEQIESYKKLVENINVALSKLV